MRVLVTLFAILAFPCVAICGECVGGGALTVPVESAVYGELEHFQALGLWRGSLADRPISRRDVARIVSEIVEGADELAAADRRRLETLERQVAAWAWQAAPRDDARYPSTLWEAGMGLRFFGGPATIDSLVLVDHHPRRTGMIHLSLNAELSGRLTAELNFYENYGKQTSRPNADDWVDNLPVDPRGLFTDPFARLSRAVIAWDHDWLRLRFGREDRRMGQGRWGSLFLSENPFPLDGLSCLFNTKHIALHSLVAQTRRGPQPPMGLDDDLLADYVNGDAWMAAHRIEIRPPGPLTVGLFEAAVWGGRGVDLAYANPAGFMIAMTQDIWDRSRTDDKKEVGADFRLDLAPVSLYGEFLLDRLVALDKATEGEEAGISSFAQLMGMRWANPLGLAGADFDIEYVHIDPQVYFHHDNDPRRAFLVEDTYNEGALIGHWLGPNTDGLFVALTLPPHARVGTFGLEFQNIRYGMVEGQTGLQMGFADLTKGEKSWITGDTATLRIGRLIWERSDLRCGLPGRLDARLSLAHVNRSGAWSPTILAERESGWQVELRLDWIAMAAWGDGWRR